LNDIINGEMADLLSSIDACHNSQQERKEIYADYDTETNDMAFREELLKHLAGNIVIKEHRVRY